MKFVKVLSLLLSVCMIAGMVPAFSAASIAETAAPEKVVFVDGTKTNGDGASPSTPFNTLGKAFSALSDGGVIVVSGKVAVSADNGGILYLPAHSAEITVTSTWNGIDYKQSNSAVLVADKTVYFAGNAKFENIEIMTTDNQTQSNGTGRIFYAMGHSLTFGDGITSTRKSPTNSYLTLVGGGLNAFTGDSNITIKSGIFANVFGGNWQSTFTGTSHVKMIGGQITHHLVGANYTGTFNGDSTLDFTGGTVSGLTVCAGNYNGNFTGNATLNMGGSASMPYGGSDNGIIGGTVGVSNGAKVTFKGNIYVNISGKATLGNNLQGTGRFSNSFLEGDIYITVNDSPTFSFNIFSAGYSSSMKGNTSLIVNGGTIKASITGGSRNGVVDGNTYIEINGGNIGYYSTTDLYGVNGGGGMGNGSITGKATMVINGGNIAENVDASDGTGGCGSVDISVRGGEIHGAVCGDGENVTIEDKNVSVDMSDGGTLLIGKSSVINSYTGGKSEQTPVYLTLSAGNTLTVNGDIKGHTKLLIKSIEYSSGDYIIAYGNTSEADISFFYLPEGNSFTQENGKWTLVCPNTYDSVTLTINRTDGTNIVARVGTGTDTATITPTSSSDTQTTYELTPGLYNFKVYYGNGSTNYVRKYVYISPSSPTKAVTIDLPAAPADGQRYEKWSIELPDEIYDAYFNNDDLEDFPERGYDTPSLSEKYEGTRQFMTNEEMCEYIEALNAECDYMHVYDLGNTESGYRMPLILFTNDSIPVGATLEQTAELINSTKMPREVFFFTAQIHGNEPAPTEAHLALAKEMTSSYGKTLLSDERIGAVILIPCVNPEGSVTFTRNNPTYNVNMNRDFMEQTAAETQKVVRAAHLFMPTVWTDCHEDWVQYHESNSMYSPIISGDLTITGLKDISVNGFSNLNSCNANASDILLGDRSGALNDCILMSEKVKDSLNSKGLHADLYTSYVNVGMAQEYAAVIGAYGFLFETYGIGTAKVNYERRIYAMESALKTLIDIVLDDGTVAQNVAERRAKTAQDGLIFDANDIVVLETTLTRSSAESQLNVNKPIIYANGTMADPDNYMVKNHYDYINRYRARATAYVFSKDVANASAILAMLDMHNVEYCELAAGTTLELKQYAGDVTLATLGAASSVTFDAGAYIVFTDSALGDLVSILFEPDNSDAGSENAVSLSQMELLNVSDIYRSEESYISRTLGFREILGDIDHSFSLENTDITLLVRLLAGFDVELDLGDRADLNSDGKLNNRDAIDLIRKLAE